MQEYATKWMWSYNHDPPNMTLGGFTIKQWLHNISTSTTLAKGDDYLNSWSITTVLPSIGRHLESLLGEVTSRASVADKVPTDAGFVTIQQISDLIFIVFGFHEVMNIIS